MVNDNWQAPLMPSWDDCHHPSFLVSGKPHERFDKGYHWLSWHPQNTEVLWLHEGGGAEYSPCLGLTVYTLPMDGASKTPGWVATEEGISAEITSSIMSGCTLSLGTNQTKIWMWGRPRFWNSMEYSHGSISPKMPPLRKSINFFSFNLKTRARRSGRSCGTWPCIRLYVISCHLGFVVMVMKRLGFAMFTYICHCIHLSLVHISRTFSECGWQDDTLSSILWISIT